MSRVVHPLKDSFSFSREPILNFLAGSDLSFQRPDAVSCMCMIVCMRALSLSLSQAASVYETTAVDRGRCSSWFKSMYECAGAKEHSILSPVVITVSLCCADDSMGRQK